jgi:hypothetical protein
MNKIILMLLATGFISIACYASDGSVTMKGSNVYTVGSKK